MTINLSVTSGLEAGRTIPPYSLPALLYFVHKILNNYYWSSINKVWGLSLQILVPTHVTLQYSFSSSNNLFTTCVQQTRRTVVPYILPTLVHFVHAQLTSSQESNINTVCVLSLSILVPTHVTLKYSLSSRIYLFTTCVQQTRRTVLPYSLPNLLL